MSSHKDDDIMWAGLGFIAGFVFFYQGFRKLRLKRLIESLPTSTTRSLAMGLVELKGRAELMGAAVDPIYDKPCAYFHILAQEYRGSGKNGHWVTIYEATSEGAPFFLRDDVGRVPVFPAGADLNLTRKVDVGSNIFDGDLVLTGGDEALGKFIFGLPRLGGNFTLKAEIIREGDPVYLIGYAVPPGDPLTFSEKMLQSAPDSLKQAARALHADPERMAKLDRNKDGQVDAEEWEAGLRDYWLEKQRAQAQQGEFLGAFVRADPSGFMYLSDKTEEECENELDTDTFLCVFGGPALTLACAAYLARRLTLL